MVTELRKRVSRRGLGMVAALALTVPLVAATPSATAAPAGTAAASLTTVATCWSGGTRIKHLAVKAGSSTVGYVNVRRYSGTSKCAQFQHAGAAKGKSRYTTIRVIGGNLQASSGGTSTSRSAGINAKGIYCITARGTISWNGATRSRSVKACSS